MYDESGVNLTFYDMTIYNGFIWFSANEHNGLYRKALTNGRLERVATFKGENLFGNRLYGKIIQYGKKIFFIPYTAEKMAIFDCEDYQLKMVDLHVNKDVKCFLKFGNAFVWHHFLFLIASSYPTIIRYDIESGEIVSCNKWVEECMQYMGNAPGGQMFRKDYYLQKNKLYLTFMKKCMVLQFDVESLEHRWYYIENNNPYFALFGENEKLLLAGKDILLTNNNFSEQRKIPFAEDVDGPIKNSIVESRKIGERVYFFLLGENRILYYDKKTQKIHQVSIEGHEQNKSYNLIPMGEEDVYLWLMDFCDSSLLLLNPITGKIRETKKFYVEKKQIDKFVFEESEQVMESEYVLKELLDYMKQSTSRKTTLFCQSVGNQIWNNDKRRK